MGEQIPLRWLEFEVAVEDAKKNVYYTTVDDVISTLVSLLLLQKFTFYQRHCWGIHLK